MVQMIYMKEKYDFFLLSISLKGHIELSLAHLLKNMTQYKDAIHMHCYFILQMLYYVNSSLC